MAIGASRQRGSMHLRGRSYMAFALAPKPPVADWLVELDEWLSGSSGFFAGRPAVLDVSAVTLTSAAIAHLVAELKTRGIRIMGIEGAPPERLGPGLPPLLTGGRPVELAGPKAPEKSVPERASLVVDSPIRSGQRVAHPAGDVIVIGAVGSGAEIVAGGSIHIYGTLRGRALAGAAGGKTARIFCRRLEAELLAIDGYYRTAEDLDGNLRGRPIQAWLAGETLMLAPIE
jgi:septum site-determining protein MinC